MKEKGSYVLVRNNITATVHHECELFCAWYKNSYVFIIKFFSKVKSIPTQCYDTASSYSTQLSFKKS